MLFLFLVVLIVVDFVVVLVVVSFVVVVIVRPNLNLKFRHHLVSHG